MENLDTKLKVECQLKNCFISNLASQVNNKPITTSITTPILTLNQDGGGN
jgi:hypothetical protein